MRIDKKAFIEKYVLENEEIIKKVIENILYLEKFPDDVTVIGDIMRSFHTIKGTSRMMGFNEMSDLAHVIEDIFTIISQGKLAASAFVIDFLFKLTDVVKLKLDSIKDGNEKMVKSLITSINAIIEYENFELIKDFKFPDVSSRETGDVKEKQKTVEKKKIDADSDVVKIRLDRLDVILKDVNEVMIHYLNVKNTTDHLYGTLQKIKVSPALNDDDIDDYYQKFYKIFKGYKEHLGKMEIYISQIQNALFDLKMLPISIVFDQLPKAARDIARQLKKRVDVEIESENSYLDKTIIEKLDEPIIHIIRNAIAHGIETPDIRKAAGKNEIGKISISSYMESGNVVITIKDDGKGIDLSKIKEKILKDNIISREELSELSDDEICQLIFLPQVSTSDGVDDVSGRGVGMDIVKKSIEEMKGTVSLKTEKNQGTEFSLLLPLTLSTISVLFILYNDIIFAVPITYIEEIINVNNINLIDVSRKKLLKHRDRLIKIIDMSRIVAMDKKMDGAQKYILILKSLDHRLGIFIEDIISESEIVIKPLPSHLKNIKYIMGVTINNINEISNIIHVPSLIDYAHLENKPRIKKHVDEDDVKRKSILIVDDAKNVRDILVNILEDFEYDIDEAENGKEALNMLQSKSYNLVLSDIKMPVMDGLSLLKSIKEDKHLKNIPVVMISSLRDKETVTRAKNLGAKRYIVKDSFKNETLANVVSGLLQ